MFYFQLKFDWTFSLWSNWPWVITGSDNGLVPNRWKPIIWTDGDLLMLKHICIEWPQWVNHAKMWLQYTNIPWLIVTLSEKVNVRSCKFTFIHVQGFYPTTDGWVHQQPWESWKHYGKIWIVNNRNYSVSCICFISLYMCILSDMLCIFHLLLFDCGR